jgi:hypothetical protein
MSLRSVLARGIGNLLMASAVMIMVSCGGGDDGLGTRYPVTGKVNYNGNPLEKGAISFIPEDPKSIGASGSIEHGAYSLSTGGSGDGARVGKYKVTVTAKEDATALAKAAFEKARSATSKKAGTEDLGFVPRQFITKAESESKSLIPAGYGDVRTTNLTAEVKPQANPLDFELSDAKAPPDPKASSKGQGRKR